MKAIVFTNDEKTRHSRSYMRIIGIPRKMRKRQRKLYDQTTTERIISVKFEKQNQNKQKTPQVYRFIFFFF